MTSFLVEKFGGKNTKVDPRILPDNVAQDAIDGELQRGALMPLRQELNIGHGTVPAASLSMFWYKRSSWLHAAYDMDVCEIPLDNDIHNRVVITNVDGPAPYPRVYSDGAYYRLGIPAPAEPVSVAPVEPVPDPNAIDVETVSYVCTFVDAWGVEGPPSVASSPVNKIIDTDVNLSLPEVPTGEYNFGAGALKRVYRSVSSSQGGVYLFVGERPITTMNETDTAKNHELQEVLPSNMWVGPPDDDTALHPNGPLRGVVAFANGILAGFSDKTVCFSDPFLYHAWPIEYRIPVEDTIVAMAAISGGVLAVTAKRPYLIAGVHPASMAVVQLDEQAAGDGRAGAASRGCVSKRGMVDMGGFAIYPSADGLVLVEGNNAIVVTDGMFTHEQWQNNYDPSNISAYAYEGKYIAFYSDTAGFVFDPRDPERAFMDVSRGYKAAAYDPQSGDLIVNDGGTLKAWMGNNDYSVASPYTWKSKKFIAPKQVSLSVARLEAWNTLATDPVTMEIWADGVSRGVVTFDDDVFTYKKLPSGFRAKTWEFELKGNNPITYAGIFESMDEVT